VQIPKMSIRDNDSGTIFTSSRLIYAVAKIQSSEFTWNDFHNLDEFIEGRRFPVVYRLYNVRIRTLPCDRDPTSMIQPESAPPSNLNDPAGSQTYTPLTAIAYSLAAW
jgi:hypothetical protein